MRRLIQSAHAQQVHLNPLHAKFFRGNMNIYLHFMPLFHIDMTQIVEIHPHVRPGPAYSIVNIMAADDLATQGARASAPMMFTMLNRINLVPAC